MKPETMVLTNLRGGMKEGMLVLDLGFGMNWCALWCNWYKSDLGYTCLTFGGLRVALHLVPTQEYQRIPNTLLLKLGYV